MAIASDAELARLAALQSYKVLDTPAERVFDSIVRLAASISSTPTALISFVDGDRQWFKAKVGLEATQTPRDISFCTHAIGSDDLFIVPDATRDPRFASNPLVTEGPGIRFYAGAPLITLAGQALGTLCVIDYVPRDFTPEEQQALRDLSQYVMAQLELRKRLTQFTQADPARQRTVATVRSAIDKNEFFLHYQPTVDLRTGHIARLEALLRWQSPQRGLFPPLEILPILEESGLIVEVGSWIFRRAAQDYRQWLEQSLEVPRMSLNITALQLQHPDIVMLIEQAMREPGRPPMFLDLEIPEAVLLGSTPEAITRIAEIQQLGVGITVDDLGADEAALHNLARLPIDSVKLDSRLVSEITRSTAHLQRVGAVIDAAHSHGLQVTAKGVETVEQRRLLGSLQCDQIQGCLIAPPAPADEVGAILLSDKTSKAREWGFLLQELVHPG